MTTLTEIAKLIRGELKAAQKAGTLDPALRFSVRTEYFSGGGAIDVTIKGYAGPVETDEYLEWQKSTKPGLPPPWRTPEIRALTDPVKAICDAHNPWDVGGGGRRFHNSIYLDVRPGLRVA